MRRIAHLSDLHFGRVELDVVAPLVDAVRALQPDITVVSGDFVQRGIRREFEQAREFIGQLPEPLIVVPGNHDMPFNNWAARFLTGLDLYREYISDNLAPEYRDEEVAIIGVNTARVWPVRGGSISREQMAQVERFVCAMPGSLVKILVTHHPFDLAESYHRRELVGRARIAMGKFAHSVDILLAGHMHLSHAGRTAVRYRLKGQSAVFVQAGTATSTRGRGEPNTFNLLLIERPSLIVQRHGWSPERRAFAAIEEERFDIGISTPACPGTQADTQDEREVEVLYPQR